MISPLRTSPFFLTVLFYKRRVTPAREHQGAPLRTYNISFVGETCGLPRATNGRPYGHKVTFTPSGHVDNVRKANLASWPKANVGRLSLLTYSISFVGEDIILPIFKNLGFFHHFGAKNALLKIFSTTLLTSFSKYDIVLL